MGCKEQSDSPAVAETYSALVRGPSALYPRGGVWMFCFWFGGLYVVMLYVGPHALWFRIGAFAAFAGAASCMIWVFRRAHSPSFAADDRGLLLGSGTGTAVPLRIGWDQIDSLTISPSAHGSTLQAILPPGTPVTSRLRRIASLALFVLPLGARNMRPELLTVLADPPRYRISLENVSPEELSSAMTVLAPARVSISIQP